MWVIVSSWRLRGYCRRKWPSLIQVALSIPLPDPRLALPRRSLALRPLFLSFSLSPRCPPPRPPPPLLLCLLPRISHFALLFPLSSTTPDMLRCFRLPLSCARIILSFGRSFLSLWKGGRGWKHFSPLFHPFFPLLFSILFFFDYSNSSFSGRIVCLGKKGRGWNGMEGVDGNFILPSSIEITFFRPE